MMPIRDDDDDDDDRWFVREAAGGSMGGDVAATGGQVSKSLQEGNLKIGVSNKKLLPKRGGGGFTGLDRHGHLWINGRQVKRTSGAPQVRAAQNERQTNVGAIDFGRTNSQVQGESPVVAALGRIGRAVLDGSLHLAHAGKNYIVRHVNRLPAPVRVPVVGTFKLAYAPYIHAQKMVAKRLADQKVSQVKIDRISAVLTMLDMALGMKILPWATSAATGLATGSLAMGGAAGLATSFVPIASLAYLAFGQVANPVRTLHAARTRVGTLIARIKSSGVKTKVREDISVGFTGTVVDSIGREYHYVNGHRIKKSDHAEHVAAGGRNDIYHHGEELPSEQHADDLVMSHPMLGGPPTQAASNIPALGERSAKKNTLTDKERQQLFDGHVKLAYAVANKWRRHYPDKDIEDLEQIAMIGLHNATQDFDASKVTPGTEVPFYNFAKMYIKTALLTDHRYNEAEKRGGKATFVSTSASKRGKGVDPEERGRASPVSDVIQKEFLRRMGEVLGRKSREYETLHRMYIDGDSSDTIAKDMGVSGAAVRLYKKAAVKKMRDAYPGAIEANESLELLFREVESEAVDYAALLEVAMIAPAAEDVPIMRRHRKLERNSDGTIRQIIEWDEPMSE
jgi:RNA polymerase sigma factor (sigma-70 family)